MPEKNADGTQPETDLTDLDDAPELTDAFFADAEMFKGDTFVQRGPGRPITGRAKEQISVRLDRDVLAVLRAAGPGWQSQVNALLRAALGLSERDRLSKTFSALATFDDAMTVELSSGKVYEVDAQIVAARKTRKPAL